MQVTGSPGSHLRNWQPATTFTEYVRNCQEGLEAYSDRRAARLLGVPRIEIYRWKLVASIPDELFERLLNDDEIKPSVKMFAAVGQALERGSRMRHAEHCPNCGHLLRERSDFPDAVLSVVNQWLSEQGHQ
jgi:hypothetical protein